MLQSCFNVKPGDFCYTGIDVISRNSSCIYIYFLALYIFLSFFFLERILFTMIGGIVREKEIRKIVVKLKERREKNCSMKFAS